MSLLIKYSFLLILPLLISACGKSNSELNRVAEVSCAIIKSTNLLQSSIRVKEVNEARTKLNLPPYLEGDKIILSSVKYNLCTSLILNETYVEKISLATQQEQDEIAAEKKRQAEIVAIETAKAEEERLLVDLMASGKKVYLARCEACHRPNGEGIPGVFPAIKGSDLALNDRPGHIDILLNGRTGTAMQAFAKKLTLSEIAAVITYQRNAWGNNTGDIVKASEVQTYASENQSRHFQKSSVEALQHEILSEKQVTMNIVRTGEDIYKSSCAACHSSGVLGAPKNQNAGDWGPRLAEKGKKGLWRNAIKGINAMPPMGVCGNCSEDDIMAAINYMIEGNL